MLKKVMLRFEREKGLDHIDVLVRASQRDKQVMELMERISGEPSAVLTVTDIDGRNHNIVTEDIISVSVRDKLSMLVTEDASYTVRLPLQSLESTLNSEMFVRISRYELVNVDKIEQYEFLANGTLRLVLSHGIETWASRRCIPAVRRRLTSD